MARNLKTYTTSAGFFDLAVAAPSMKAALEAWGSKNNLFHHGFAKISEDPKIVAATMAHPGVVLRRPVGSSGAFSEHAKLPADLPVRTPQRAPSRSAKRREPPTEAVDDKTAREAARAFEKEQKRRQSERRSEEAARQKERARRERAIAAAEAALERARRDHQARLEDIEKDRVALDKKSQAEDALWRKKKEELEAGLRRARSGSHLHLV
ncbi:MAG: cell envelope biogenesis protein TolA [Rhodospirillales bacterium]|nr:cell envelope biogenesis protein TolA [Rhodospirillales bacterium]